MKHIKKCCIFLSVSILILIFDFSHALIPECNSHQGFLPNAGSFEIVKHFEANGVSNFTFPAPFLPCYDSIGRISRKVLNRYYFDMCLNMDSSVINAINGFSYYMSLGATTISRFGIEFNLLAKKSSGHYKQLNGQQMVEFGESICGQVWVNPDNNANILIKVYLSTNVPSGPSTGSRSGTVFMRLIGGEDGGGLVYNM